jgi:predicted GNAT superfamily acetyltransferase
MLKEKQQGIVVLSGKVTRELLRRGYSIIDVKADKTNKDKSVFVFRRENYIESVLAELTKYL